MKDWAYATGQTGVGKQGVAGTAGKQGVAGTAWMVGSGARYCTGGCGAGERDVARGRGILGRNWRTLPGRWVWVSGRAREWWVLVNG